MPPFTFCKELTAPSQSNMVGPNLRRRPMETPAKEMSVERAREVLGAFLDEFHRVFEPTSEEIEAMRVLLRAA
jgi:hypothetical protein